MANPSTSQKVQNVKNQIGDGDGHAIGINDSLTSLYKELRELEKEIMLFDIYKKNEEQKYASKIEALREQQIVIKKNSVRLLELQKIIEINKTFKKFSFERDPKLINPVVNRVLTVPSFVYPNNIADKP